jgi:DNA-binding NarL/FixJ family response regulator
MKNTIVIVDDHVLIAKALHSIISNFNQFEVLYECENGMELIEKFSSKTNIPNVVLLDISMPIMDGFESAKWIKENHPDVLIMTLSMQDDEQSLIRMIKNGAKGYLLKNAHPSELENALNALIKNGYYYPDWAANHLFANINKSTSQEDIEFNFNEKEIEFLKYIVTELTYKEIAVKMFCSPRTVEGYRDNLCEKLELKSRVGLAVFAIKNGII